MRIAMQERGDTSRWVALLALATCGFGVNFFGFTKHLWLPSLYSIPHLDTPKILGVTAEALLWFMVTAGVLWVAYLTASILAAQLPSSRSSSLAIIGLGGAVALPLVLMYPGAAADVYAYIAEADLALRYGVNPFQVPASAFPDLPLLPFLDYPNETTHYGPLWLVIGIVLRLAAGQDLLAALIAFKLAALVSLFGLAWAVYLSVRISRPREANVAALLVAWNPLLLFEAAGNGHNDFAMMLFVGLAFYFRSRGRVRASLLALAAACLVKYVAVVLVPLFLVAALRSAWPPRGWLLRASIEGAAAGLLGIGLLAQLGTEGTVGILQELQTWFTTSVGAAAYHSLARSMPAAEAAALVGNVAKAVYALAYVPALVAVWRRPARLQAACLYAMLVFMAVETVWFQPWYAAWALPIAALAGGPIGTALAMGTTFGGFGIHATMGFAWRLWWRQSDPSYVHLMGAAAMWGPVILALLVGLIISLVHRRSNPARSALRTSPGRPPS